MALDHLGHGVPVPFLAMVLFPLTAPQVWLVGFQWCVGKNDPTPFWEPGTPGLFDVLQTMSFCQSVSISIAACTH